MRWRGGSGVWVLVCVELACGAARHPAMVGSSKAGSVARATTGSEVSGIVVDAEEHWPLSGRLVEIAGQRALTDAQGRFHIPHAPPVYDARISEADGSWVTLYRSVARRDPLLGQHVANPMVGPRERTAHVKIVLKGVAAAPLGRDTLLVQLRTSKTRDQSVWSGNDALDLPPMLVAWNGAESQLPGEVVVLRLHYTGRPYQELAPGEVFAQHMLARQELVLTAGQTSLATLELAPLPAFHVTGAVESASTQVNWNQGAFVQQEVERDYRWLFGKFGSVIHGPLVSATGAFDYWIDGPPLSEPSRILCLWLRSPRALTQRCGVSAAPSPSEPLSLDPPPRLLLPSLSEASQAAAHRERRSEVGEPLTEDSQFSWQGPPGVTRLRVAADSATAGTPSFDVYTNDTGMRARDFVPPVRLSRSEASYRVELRHFGPFPTVDAAVAKTGIAALAPRELRTSDSDEVPVVTVPAAPPGAAPPAVNVPIGVDPARAVPWAPCQYPVGTDISCGNGAWFSLTAINNRLRHFPELAFDAQIHCVTNCAEAEAFVTAQSAYSTAHPGHLSSEPLDLPQPPPPPLPPDAGEPTAPAGAGPSVPRGAGKRLDQKSRRPARPLKARRPGR